ncbi:phosphoenolpyruvate synthase [Streptomyces sp. NPDC048484]|uniref:phosphoenolpyruvate synthase n=1 Tax=Streptomyces sp. NPDC048484 TaxID=3155146 RepID=UPI00341BCC3F
MQAPMGCLTHNSPPDDVDRLAGGKGRGLYRLTDAGLRVPPWAVIGADVFHRHCLTGGLTPRLRELLEKLREQNVESCAREIEQLILAHEPDPETRSVIEDAYRQVGSGPVAVRSSGVEEDGELASFAGQFTTYLNISGLPQVVRRVQQCWASAYSARCLTYRLRHELPPRELEIAAVIQCMVHADRSGVLFTANPVTGSRDEFVVSAVHGLGEGLVSGAVDADTVVFDRVEGAVKSSVVGEKRQRYTTAAGQDGYVVREVPADQRAAPALTAADLARLREAGRRAEEIFGRPQDVEWAISGDDLWILQSRTITTLPTPDRPPSPPAHVEETEDAEEEQGELRIWDNSNIIESYSGITAPLTFSFASHVYHRVHVEYCRTLGLPYAQRCAMDDWLRNLLGQFGGRVYYNLFNWYRLVGLLPLYRMNRRVLEISIGSAPLDEDQAQSVSPLRCRSRGIERWYRFVITLRFLRYFLFVQWAVRRFLAHFYAVYDRFEDVDYNGLPAEEVHRHFVALEQDLILKWGPMAALEAVIGWCFGLLLALTKRWLPDAPQWFYWKVARPLGEVESVEPARRLSALAERVRRDPDLERIVTQCDLEEIYQRLSAEGHQEIVDEIDTYIRRFGYRSLNELKLEEPDLRQDPTLFFRMLRGALDATTTPAGEQDESVGEQDVLAVIDERLHGVRRMVYALMRRKTRKAFAARERVRFCRTRAFGIVRRMMRAMGADLARSGALAADQDVFYLRLDELLAGIEGRMPRQELAALVELRKGQEAEFACWEAPARFTTTGPAYRTADLKAAGWTLRTEPDSDTFAASGEELRGTPCGPGVAEGVVRVISSPHDVGGGVLVAYRTDPGWAAVLPSASALLIERGSPLTHVAIIARELRLPTVVQIDGLTRRLRTGMRVRVDGTSGTVTILD